MPILIPGSDTAHDFTSLTDAINKRSRKPRQFGQRISVNSRGVRDKSVVIDRKGDTIDIIDPKGWDQEPDRSDANDYNTFSLPVQHYPGLVTVRPDEVSGRREFGTETGYEMPETRLNEKLDVQRDKFELTWEFQLINAAQGLVKNRAGGTVLNLATQFEIGPSQILCDFDDADLDVIATARKIKRAQEAKLGEYTVDRWIWFVTGDYFEALVSKESIIRAYDRWQESAFLRADNRSGFTVADNVEIVEYNNAMLPGGQTVFPTTGDAAGGIFVPVAAGLFQRRFSPAQDMDNVNQEGLPMYASPEDLPHRKGVDVLTETNFVTYCQRPEAVGVVKQG